MEKLVEWAVIDTETTGLGPGARIVEIAIVVLNADLAEVSSWSSLIDPQSTVGATRVHGLSQGDLVGAPSFRAVALTVETLLAGRRPVAHNLDFDWGMLRREFQRLEVEVPPDHRGVCTARMCEDHFGARYPLGDLCERLGFPHSSPHQALPDALAAAEVFRRLRSLGKEPALTRALPGFARSWTLPRSEPAQPRSSTPRSVGVGSGYRGLNGEVAVRGEKEND